MFLSNIIYTHNNNKCKTEYAYTMIWRQACTHTLLITTNQLQLYINNTNTSVMITHSNIKRQTQKHIQKHTDTQTYRYTKTQSHNHINTHTHNKHTDTQTHKQTNTQTHKHIHNLT